MKYVGDPQYQEIHHKHKNKPSRLTNKQNKHNEHNEQNKQNKQTETNCKLGKWIQIDRQTGNTQTNK